MKIVMIGTGNVASVFARLFHGNGHQIEQVYGRDSAKAKNLAEQYNGSYTSNLKLINRTADLYVVAVSDDAIPGISGQLNLDDRLIVHTAGSVPAHVLKAASREFGVFYPLQSLKQGKNAVIPLLVEASSPEALQVLENLASSIGSSFQVCTGDQRLHMHLAAVWVNNFPNLLYAIAYRICQESMLDFALLKPLLTETAERQNGSDPIQWQTGPAMRNDQKTLEAHLQLLEGHRQWKTVYNLLSAEIRSMK